MSSSIPTITDVLYYTNTDAYNYLTDNRPIYQLDDNIRSVAASLVGLGYGEHSAVNGGLLTPGCGVELLSNGQIRYPVDNNTPKITGVVIGATGAGLTKVIWGSLQLDLDAVGLPNLLSTAPAGYYIVVSIDGLGTLSAKSPVLTTDVVVGQVKEMPYISIGTSNSASSLSDPTPDANYHNLYGLTRVRNLILMDALDSSPVQYTKLTTRQSDIGMTIGATINPLNISFNPTSQIISPPSTSTISYTGYGTDSGTGSWVIVENYTRYPSNSVTGNAVSYQNGSGITQSYWQNNSFNSLLTYGSNTYSNYDLETLNGGYSYSSTDLFQQFVVNRYYSYGVLPSSSPAYGKPTARITVFDPQSIGRGGEPGPFIVCDFTQYNLSTGLESRKDRVILTGQSAVNLYTDPTVFTNSITSL